MSDTLRTTVDLPPHQQAVRDKSFHPTGTWIEFKKEDIEQSIPERFEQQVAKYPDRLAVKTRNHELSYKQLNQAANCVARAILEKRGESEEPIGLLLDNDALMIAAIIGVLKAGKFFVVLDPYVRRTRLTYMLEDSQAGLILTNNSILSLAREFTHDAHQLINIDVIDANLSTGNLDISSPPVSSAGIYYTSGSTGQPKGVVLTHRNLLHRTMTYTNDFHICREDRQSLLYSFSFSASARPIFGALLNGATLFPFDFQKEGLSSLSTWLIQHDITLYSSVTSVFRHFTDALTGKEKFPKLRLIRLGSERATTKDVEQYKKHFSGDCVLNHQMATGETGEVRQYLLDRQTPITGSRVPVGYAVEDKEILLIDDAGQEVGLNQIGEIAVKSRYLAPGYWRRPDLTQAKFLPDRNDRDTGVYLTGDLGLMLSDGCLLHLGRKDFEVKIRGYRVEVAEIEEALLDLEAVKEAVVVAREDHSGDQRLMAYLVPKGQATPTVTRLRRALVETLPDSMIPSTFVFMDTLPQTPTGKVDRQALPAPDIARPELETPFARPRTPVEEVLVGIWTEVLDLDQVGIHDNFLELGGNSLLATQVISRVMNRFHIEVPLRVLLESPTVADMATVIVQSQAGRVEQEGLECMLAELEALSDEQAKQLLAVERATS